MRPDQYWKNFNLGTELDIAGRFLFNGLRTFHEMEHFAHVEDTFEFLYGVAVGIERLLKIAIILTEHDKVTNQIEFEKGLITHSHQELIKRLKASHEINLSSRDNEFINILSDFYKSRRYDRYSLASVAFPAKERDDLIDFLNKYLQINIEVNGLLNVTQNEMRYKKFLGRVISKIVLQIFGIVESEATRLNIYTFEIDSQSKASKIFNRKSFDFEDEDTLQIELIAYFISSEASGSNSKFIRNIIKPLPFDPGLEGEYLAALRFDRCKLMVLDELEEHYAHIENFNERRSMLETAIYDHLDYGENEDQLDD